MRNGCGEHFLTVDSIEDTVVGKELVADGGLDLVHTLTGLCSTYLVDIDPSTVLFLDDGSKAEFLLKSSLCRFERVPQLQSSCHHMALLQEVVVM